MNLLQTLAGGGASYQQVRKFLSSFGSNFALIESDANAVIAREQSWRAGDGHPAVDLDVARELLRSWDARAEISLGVLLDAVNADQERYRSLHERHKRATHEFIGDARRRYRTEKGIALTTTPEGLSRTAHIRHALVRHCIAGSEEFEKGDGPDLEHASVSLSYADYVVLDPKWTRWVRSLTLPTGAGEVFSVLALSELVERVARHAGRHGG